MKKKKLYLEFIRVIAILLVCFNHTSTSGLQAYVLTDSAPKYIVYFTISLIAKSAVPLFFMISGALLIPKEEDLKTLYKKRIARMAIILLLVSLYYYYQNICLFNLSRFQPQEFLTMFIHCSISTPLWYLYSYICVLMCLPLLRKLSKAMSNKDFIYLIFLALGMQVFEMIFQVENMDEYKLIFVDQLVFFPLMGYYIDQRIDIKSIKTSYAIGSLGITLLFGILNALLSYYRIAPSADPFVQFYLFKGLVTTTLPIFLSVKILFERHQANILFQKIITVAGSCCFGIYLIEGILRNLLYYPIDDFLLPRIHALPASFICVFIECIVGVLIIYILKHVPLIKKVI